MIDVALKEWQIICDLLLEGRLGLVLRKGGIHEKSGPGEFELAYQQFALFPTWEHQKPEMIEPDWRAGMETREPRGIPLKGYAEAAGVWQVPDKAALDAIDDCHPWTDEQIEMRLGYRPDRPLFLVAVRAYAVDRPKTIRYRSEFAGCHSWVPLKESEAVDPAGATPAMGDAAFEMLTARIDAAMAQG
jgi:hypothetical protein